MGRPSASNPTAQDYANANNPIGALSVAPQRGPAMAPGMAAPGMGAQAMPPAAMGGGNPALAAAVANYRPGAGAGMPAGAPGGWSKPAGQQPPPVGARPMMAGAAPVAPVAPRVAPVAVMRR
jgi:hypothetical protein